MADDEFPPDGQWVRAAVRRYEASLILYAQRLTGNAERGRDVAQETFLKLVTQKKELIESHLAEWLFSVARNLALDMRRKEKRMTALNVEHLQTQQTKDLEPGEQAERSESAARVFDALELLPENQQEVIRLKFQHGLSYKEISAVTNLSVTNVGFLIHTGLKAIRERVEVPST
jgi:RNA polymerase sigma factor (sigma-70 family)